MATKTTKPFALQELYNQTRQYVEQGERHIQRQREIVSELEADGHDIREAQDLLSLFLEIQALHVAHMHQLNQDLKHSAP